MNNRIGAYTLCLSLICFFQLSTAKATTNPYRVPCTLIANDTIPATKPEPSSKGPVEPTEVVIKQVPKSRKQMKPLVVPNINAVKPKRIIQPRINIRTGLIP